jgi:hypothetical protein
LVDQIAFFAEFDNHFLNVHGQCSQCRMVLVLWISGADQGRLFCSEPEEYHAPQNANNAIARRIFEAKPARVEDAGGV